MKKVQILLSTYNGEKYLHEQLNSILNQDYPNFTVLIRDDGSVDHTIEILEDYAKKDKRISFYQGDNLGVKKSFYDLLINADINADYYSLADQDDVWKSNKISSAVKLLMPYDNIPGLYCGRTELVDADLNPINSKIKKAKIHPDFGNALVENICTGCTCLFNNALRNLVTGEVPEYCVMHDWWLYLSASAFGIVLYDEKSYILYRQHGNNIIGTKSTYYTEFINRLQNYKSNRGQIRKQLEAFQRIYPLNNQKDKLTRYVIDAKKNFIKRLNIIFDNKIYRQRKLDNIIFKLLFLFGQI